MNRLQELLFPASPDHSPEILVLADSPGSRLDYVLDFIFRKVLLCRYRLTTSTTEFQSCKAAKLNYSSGIFDSALNIKPEGLLQEKNLRHEKPILHFRKEQVSCFITGSPGLAIEMEQDVLALVFYFISRYEEWQETNKDEHGRFPAAKSLLESAGAGTWPIVDFAVKELKEKMQALFPDLKFPTRRAALISTIDVDNLFAFQEKPLWRQAGASVRDLIQGDFKQLMQRIRVLKGDIRDPFDIYDEVPAFCAENDIPLLLFFLYAPGSVYDRSIKPGAIFKNVFDRLSQYPCRIGLHPSYHSSTKENLLNEEAQVFRQDSGVDELWSRQHFLRFDIRTVAECLIQAGIHMDFSMGWSDRAGFRAGTAFPFLYYDFQKESVRDLHFVPFCLMDGAYSIHHRQGREHILQDAFKMADQIKACGSYFVSVYHERSFYDHLYPGFGPLYKELHLGLKERFSA